MNAELLEKYADFIVRVGVNVQPGQTLIVNAPLEAAPLARLCVKSAFAAGECSVCARLNAVYSYSPHPAASSPSAPPHGKQIFSIFYHDFTTILLYWYVRLTRCFPGIKILLCLEK